MQPDVWPLSNGYSRPPYACLVGGSYAAGADGLILARFGWADPSSWQVSNSYTSGFLLGFVLPVEQMWNWERVYHLPPNANLLSLPILQRITGYENPAIPAQSPSPMTVLRSGQQCVLASVGDFYVRFDLGAMAGYRVYADPNTGAPLSGNSSNLNAVPTPWVVMNSGGCGSRIRISTSVSSTQ